MSVDEPLISASRLSDANNAEDERTLHSGSNLQSSQKPNNPQKLTLNRNPAGPICKLGCYNIFVRNQKKFCKKNLPKLQRNSLKSYHHLKEQCEKDIIKFVKRYQTVNEDIEKFEDEGLLKRDDEYLQLRRDARLTKHMSYNSKEKKSQDRPLIKKSSSKSTKNEGANEKQTQGAYFLNNWRSYEQYYCDVGGQRKRKQSPQSEFDHKKASEELIPKLVYAVIDMNHDLALKIINTLVGESSSTNIPVLRLEVDSIGADQNKAPRKKNSCVTSTIEGLLRSIKIVIQGLKTILSIIKITDYIRGNNEMSECFINTDEFLLSQMEELQDSSAKVDILSLSDYIEYEFNHGRHKNLTTKNTGKFFSNIDTLSDHKNTFLSPDSPLVSQSPLRRIPKSVQNVPSYQYRKLESVEQKSEKIWNKFFNLSKKQKKACLLHNLMFLIKFAKRIKVQTCTNDYLKIIICFLRNDHNQTEIKETEYVSELSEENLAPLTQFSEAQIKIPWESDVTSTVEKELNLRDSVDFLQLLIELKDLKIYDRINFATRLLTKEKNSFLVSKLGSHLAKLPFLDNILFFANSYQEQRRKAIGELNSYKMLKHAKTISVSPKKRKASEHTLRNKSVAQSKKNLLKQSLDRSISNYELIGRKIEKICQNYIDEYGDLSTVAYLTYDYSCLSKFNDFYRESLMLSYESEELEKLDEFRFQKSRSSPSMINPIKMSSQSSQQRIIPKVEKSFLSHICFAEKSIRDPICEQNLEPSKRRCEICNLEISPYSKDCYIECSKCRHGGHLQHIVSWYNSYQHCPNVECACLCN